MVDCTYSYALKTNQMPNSFSPFFFFFFLIGRQNFIQHVKKIQYHEHMHAQQDMDDASLAMNRSFLYF